MADGPHIDVLGQKAQAAQRAFEARGMSPAKAMRRALSRTADVLWDLALVAQDVSLDTLDQDGVIDCLKAGELLVLLDGPDGGIGLACVDREVMTALIEVQTIQQVTQMPVDDRPLTTTDAAMVAPLIDGTLDRLVINLVDHPLLPQLEGYRFGAMLEDPRAASLLLEAPIYRSFHAHIDLALGRRRGSLAIFLPDREIEKPKSTDGDAQGAPGPHADALGRVPTRLEAVLGRVSMPLHAAQSLKVGDLLELSPTALDRVEFIAGKSKPVARGRLGQLSGMRAIKLNWPERVGGPVVGAPGFSAASADEDAPSMQALAPLEDPAPQDDFAAPAFDMAPMDDAEMSDELPDLPPMDFASDVDAFDADLAQEAEGDAESTDFDMDFSSSTMDFDAAAMDET